MGAALHEEQQVVAAQQQQVAQLSVELVAKEAELVGQQ